MQGSPQTGRTTGRFCLSQVRSAQNNCQTSLHVLSGFLLWILHQTSSPWVIGVTVEKDLSTEASKGARLCFWLCTRVLRDSFKCDLRDVANVCLTATQNISSVLNLGAESDNRQLLCFFCFDRDEKIKEKKERMKTCCRYFTVSEFPKKR